MNDLTFNKRLKYYREKSNISKSELARIIGVSPSYITKLENGEKSNPSLSIKIKIANSLGCSISDLTGEEKTIRAYVLQLFLENGFTMERISQNLEIPLSELENIANGDEHNNEYGLKLIKGIPKLVVTPVDLSVEEENHIYDLRKLNDIGKNKVINYTKDLIEMPKYQKHICEEEEKEHLMPIACHNDNLTDEEKENMDNIIDDFLKNKKE